MADLSMNLARRPVSLTLAALGLVVLRLLVTLSSGVLAQSTNDYDTDDDDLIDIDSLTKLNVIRYDLATVGTPDWRYARIPSEPDRGVLDRFGPVVTVKPPHRHPDMDVQDGCWSTWR